MAQTKQKIPVNKIFEVLKSAKRSSEAAQCGISILILVDDSAPKELISTIHDAFLAEKSGAIVAVYSLTDDYSFINPDICIVICGDNGSMTERAVRWFAGKGIAVACICDSALVAPSPNLPQEKASLIGTIASTDTVDLLDKLARWIVRITDNNIAYPANFSFIRDASVESLVSACAAQNAAIGAVALIPGADMPLMTTNQAKLALDIAAVYGEELAPERVLELAGVLGAGFAYRGIARQILGLVPAVGTFIKAGMGYAGTVATGKAVKARFDMGSTSQGQTPNRFIQLTKSMKTVFFKDKDSATQGHNANEHVISKVD